MWARGEAAYLGGFKHLLLLGGPIKYPADSILHTEVLDCARVEPLRQCCLPVLDLLGTQGAEAHVHTNHPLHVCSQDSTQRDS